MQISVNPLPRVPPKAAGTQQPKGVVVKNKPGLDVRLKAAAAARAAKVEERRKAVTAAAAAEKARAEAEAKRRAVALAAEMLELKELRLLKEKLEKLPLWKEVKDRLDLADEDSPPPPPPFKWAFNRMLIREPGVERIWKNLLQKVHYASAKPQNTRVRSIVPPQPDWFQVTRLAVDAGPELVQLVDNTTDI